MPERQKAAADRTDLRLNRLMDERASSNSANFSVSQFIAIAIRFWIQLHPVDQPATVQRACMHTEGTDSMLRSIESSDLRGNASAVHRLV